MSGFIQTTSLLPYLCGDAGKLCLNIANLKRAFDQNTSGPCSLQPEYTDDLLAAGFRAQICTDFGSPVREVMLLTQRDNYPFLNGFHPEITNTRIDSSWRNAVLHKASKSSISDTILFSEQFDSKGNFRTFSSLFYCRKKEMFFHPPCPRCGKILSLCQDDELLLEFSLPHYSKSRKRFMYCPTCTPLHGGPWYTKISNDENSSVVKDFKQLINDFGSIQNGIGPDTQFPCADCSFHKDCYSGLDVVFNNILSFSFYPFYMITTRASTCSMHRYLALISGASEEQLAKYWVARNLSLSSVNNEKTLRSKSTEYLLYPKKDPRHFLEILYLKIQCIKLIAIDLLDRGNLPSLTENYISTNTIGVSLESDSALPRYWAISLSHSAYRGDLLKVVPPLKQPPSDYTFSIGLLWFAVLLSNHKQDESEIFQQLKVLLQEGREEFPAVKNLGEVFQSYQLFWSARLNPDQNIQWADQWEKVLSAGYKFLIAGYRNEILAKSNIVDSIQTCLAEIKRHLLPHQLKEAPHNNRSEHLEIIKILNKVNEKWGNGECSQPNQQFFEKSPDPKIETLDNQATTPRVDPDETIIISSSSKTDQRLSSPLENSSGALPDTAFLKTQLISSREGSDKVIKLEPSKFQSPSIVDSFRTQEVEDLEKTVRLQRAEKTGSKVSASEKEKVEPDFKKKEEPLDEDDFLTETVVLKPSKKES